MSWFSENDSRTLVQKLFGNFLTYGPIPKHIAIIMDGNRRFAKQNKVEKINGHNKGFEKLTEVLFWCNRLGIKEVTVYAFSIENFKRSKEEVEQLFNLARKKFEKLVSEKYKNDNYLFIYF
jgi:ditrans,polycis-polyprenyl diphosphate synthase